ncbi:MAG: TauD/TfdA family dioxygenase [Myxococcales bacterium]|nr:TauD/TfdA family dioxygenase [Myxococcales bacterium]HIK84250.1 TauD/TfdA family dioxygenase [Myxococcales bacterium]
MSSSRSRRLSTQPILQIRPLATVGAEVLGFDMNAPIDANLAHQLRQLWYEHGMLLFRDQDIDAKGQIAFSRLFGTLERHPLEVTISHEHPELFTLENGGDRDPFNTAYYHGQPTVGRLDWHMDLHYTARPNHGAVLRAVTIADEDGETGFGDLARAYEGLDADQKSIVGKIEVAYRFNMQRLDMRFVDLEGYEPGPQSPKKPSDIGFPDFADAVYPAAVMHPVTGMRVLEIVEQFLDRVIDPERAGLSEAQADDLLRDLVDHIRKPEFHYFHTWQSGDVVLWDNWRFMHCTTGTRPGVKRLINRTTIGAGDVALGRVLKG